VSPILGNFLQTVIKKVFSCAFSRPAESSDPALAPAICNPISQERGLACYALPAVLIAAFIVLVVYASSTLDFYPYSGRFPRTKTEFLKPGRLDRKLSRLEKKIKTNPNDIRAFFESGLLKFQKGPERYIDAISELETARSGGLSDIRTFYYLGQMYQAVGLYDFALEEYRRFLNNRPDDLEVSLLAAKLLFHLGKYPLAVKEYEGLSARHPENVIVLENLALSRWKNGQDPKSILDIMGGLDAEAAFRAEYVSGRINYENKQYAAAASRLERAAADLLKYPEFSDRAGLYQMLSDCYVKLKAEARAIDALNELLKISPANDEARSLLARLVKIRSKTAAK